LAIVTLISVVRLAMESIPLIAQPSMKPGRVRLEGIIASYPFYVGMRKALAPGQGFEDHSG
jgi:hypothetical protein